MSINFINLPETNFKWLGRAHEITKILKPLFTTKININQESFSYKLSD